METKASGNYYIKLYAFLTLNRYGKGKFLVYDMVQVRYTFVKGSLKLEMPPPFSVVIQVCFYNLKSDLCVSSFV